jgi:pyrimidine operon attenuation protein/uracil phosphoribosyltransferase
MTDNVNQLLDKMTEDCRSWFQHRNIGSPQIIGIHTGGAWVAEALRKRLGIDSPAGSLNITFYRDDYSRIGLHPQVNPSDIPFDVEGQHLLLVDDVLYTGRTIRAALNEIFDYGRPASVTLAVLIQRDGRELPIEAQIIGTSLQLEADQQVKVLGPDPLEYRIETREPKS